MPFSTEIYLRRAEREDLDTIVEWMEHPDFAQFLYGDPARSPKQIREQIVGMMGRSAMGMLPGGIYLLIDSPAFGLVGLLSIVNLSWRNRSCTVDLYIGQRQLRSRTIAAFAAYRAIEYCFDELNLHRVGAYIYSFNSPSWRLFEKMGAVRELTLRDHIAREGVFHDVYGYGLLRHEFEAFRQAHARAFAKLQMTPSASSQKQNDVPAETSA